jgi:hypothetical protein
VNNNLLSNYPVTQQNITAAEHILQPDIRSLKRKAVEPRLMNILHSILSRYHNITICANIMFVNKISFFMSISQNIKFGTAEMLSKQQNQILLKASQQIHSIYLQRFQVNLIYEMTLLTCKSLLTLYQMMNMSLRLKNTSDPLKKEPALYIMSFHSNQFQTN